MPILFKPPPVDTPPAPQPAPVAKPIGRRLGDRLVAVGAIAREQAEYAASTKREGERIGEALVRQGATTQDKIVEALRWQRGEFQANTDNSLDIASLAAVLYDMGVKSGHVRATIERAEATGETLPQIARDYGFLTQEQVAEAISRLTGYDYFSHSQVDAIDTAIVSAVPLKEFRGFVPVGRHQDGALILAVSDAGDVNRAKNEFYQERTRIVIASESTIQTVYRRFFARTEQEFDRAVEAMMRLLRSRTEDEDPGLMRAILGSLLRHACYVGASDLYLHKSEHVGVIKLKINGVGTIFRSIDKEIFDRLLNKLVTENGGRQEDLKRQPQEAVIQFVDEEAKRYEDIVTRYGFRLQLAETRGNRTAVIRILDKQATFSELPKLGFDDATYRKLVKVTNTATGLFLVTGPTGSGKTSTLYAILRAIDPVERSIQTIENPIEYSHGLWMQYEGSKALAHQEETTEDREGREFQKWLKHLLRNAPDVVLVGEVRDAFVARVLLDASNTGHLVFSTLHTNNAALAMARLRDLGVNMPALANVLLGVLSQRLVRTLCPYCRKPDERQETVTALSVTYIQSSGPAYRAGEGCPHCKYTGYRSRRMIYELLDVTPEVRRLIEDEKAPSEIAEAGIKEGHSMWACGLKLVAQGATSLDEVIRVTQVDGY